MERRFTVRDITAVDERGYFVDKLFLTQRVRLRVDFGGIGESGESGEEACEGCVVPQHDGVVDWTVSVGFWFY